MSPTQGAISEVITGAILVEYRWYLKQRLLPYGSIF